MYEPHTPAPGELLKRPVKVLQTRDTWLLSQNWETSSLTEKCLFRKRLEGPSGSGHGTYGKTIHV